MEKGRKECFIGICCFPLGIKFIPEIDSDSDSDQEEDPELEICQVERQISEDKPQATSVKDMTPISSIQIRAWAGYC